MLAALFANDMPAVTVWDTYAPATGLCLHPPLVFSDVTTCQYEAFTLDMTHIRCGEFNFLELYPLAISPQLLDEENELQLGIRGSKRRWSVHVGFHPVSCAL